MKIRVEFELTPEELRESLGLPNIAGLQDEALAMLTKRLSDDIENIDLASVVQSWFSQGIAASRKVQEMFATAAAGILDLEPDNRRKTAAKKAKRSSASRKRKSGS